MYGRGQVVGRECAKVKSSGTRAVYILRRVVFGYRGVELFVAGVGHGVHDLPGL